jgi:hypothetical protein
MTRCSPEALFLVLMRGLGLQSITEGERTRPHGRARGISFGGAVLPRGRPATRGQDGSPPIALARGPADAWSRIRKASGLDPNNLLRSYD